MGSYDKAIVVTGRVFQDALAIAPYAAAHGYPILLTEKDKLPDYDLPKQVIIIGSSFSVSDSVENQIKKLQLCKGFLDQPDMNLRQI